MRAALPGPSIEFLNLLIDIYEEDDPSGGLRQVPDDMLELQYSASSVNADMPQKMRLLNSSVYWQVQNTASVCRDAQQTLKGLDLAGFRDWGIDAAGMFPSLGSTKTLVCLTRRKKEYPDPGFICCPFQDGKPPRDVSYVTTDLSLTYNDDTNSRRPDAVRFPDRYSTVERRLPLEAIERVVLNHDKHPGNEEGCCHWPSIYRLWPFQIPNLKEVYLIDESMALRDNSRPPPEPRERIKGFCGTFFEVTEHDGDIWNPLSAALLAQAAEFDQEFEDRAEPGYTIPTVKILACVPHYKLVGPVLAASDGPIEEAETARGKKDVQAHCELQKEDSEAR